LLERLLQERQEQVLEGERLRRLLDLQQVMPVQSIVCGVMARDGVPWFRTLTLDKGTSRLGQGPSAHSCLVEVAPYRGTVPPVTAFEPPRILDQA